MPPPPADSFRRAAHAPRTRILLPLLLTVLLSWGPAVSALGSDDPPPAGAGASANAAAALPSPDADVKLERRLALRLETAGDFDVIRIGVTLDESGLPRREARPARRAEIAARRQRALDGIPGADFRLGRSYENLAGFSGQARPAAIRALLQRTDVAHVYVDGEVHATLAQGVPLVGADVAHAAGFTGAGVNVALLDTGIDTDHPDLVDDIIDERCYCDDGGNPTQGCCPNGGEFGSGPGSAEDDNGHGTSVAGIVTASGAVTGPGVAPDAGIVAIKVLRASGSGAFSDVAAGLDWLISNHASLGVKVVNLSLSDGGEYANPLASPCSGTNTSNAIRDLTAAGVAVFLASGNDGHDDGISYPACAPDAISVGGVYDANVGSVSWCGATCAVTLCTDNPTSSDTFVCHSNSDELLDLLAPDYRTRTSAMGGGANNGFSGTSAASPYAAALGALLFEQQPTRTVADVLGLLTSNGPMVTNDDNGLAFRRTDVSSLFPFCGDGQLDPGEDCDDGNQTGGDCCSAACLHETAGSACDDANACTSGDACDGSGGCVAGAPVVCDDGLFCNGAESCDDATGCVTGAPPVCDDGLFCNGSESCDDVTGCLAGAPPLLDDLVGCTVDACDEAGDVVTHVPDDALCSDSSFCNGEETCDPVAGCLPGLAPSVDDGVGCTIDGCDEAADVLTHVPDDVGCDDGLYCNGVEICDLLADCQPGAPPETDDGVACTTDGCDELVAMVTHVPDDVACDDGDVCTAEACDAVLGCTSDPIPGCGVPVPSGRASGPILGLVALGWALLEAARSRRRSARASARP